MASSYTPPRRNAPPHLRLNSGSQNILVDYSPDNRSSARQLTPQPSSRPGTASSKRIPTPLYARSLPAAESAELLLPPGKSRTPRRFRDDDSPLNSPLQSPLSSRRSSWSSDGTESRMNPFISPYDDSRAPSRTGSEDDNLNTQTVSEKYNIIPSAGLLLFPEDVEKDDYMHTPGPDDNDRDCDIWTGRGMVNLGGLVLVALGILMLFIGFPVLSFVQNKLDPVRESCSGNPTCIDVEQPLLKNVRRGLIDPDTPDDVKSRKGANGKKQKLVFSDEFNTPGRTFYDNDDPYFQGMDFWYGVTQDLEWYDPDAITTEDGILTIRFDAFKNHGLNYRSGMLQSWNKLCFKGGYIEASISLPGRGDTIGFWPGFWTMGNLGRPGYAATTDGTWPYSYHDECDAGITHNQSQTDGISYLPGMRFPACTCRGEDHPSPGKSRSAPEIDAIEASVEFLDNPNLNGIGSASQSLQVAPFDVWYHPNYEQVEVYDYSVTRINSYAGGPYQQALSGLTNLNNDWYDGKAYQKYAFDYRTGDDGYVAWYVGDVRTWTVYASALGPNGNIGKRVIPEEPMAIVANFGMSNSFAALNLSGIAATLPATMRVDYIRIYQQEGEEMVTCDPPGYPTTEYIRRHPEPYRNFNLTLWKQTEYDWPKNSLVNGCEV